MYHLIKVALSQGTPHPSTEAFLVMHPPGVWGKGSVEEWENLDFMKTRFNETYLIRIPTCFMKQTHL